MTAVIQNPVLKGFNPDPSICRVGDDYYIATSTFEWFPGVQIHHSKDLVNWELISHPLSRVSQLDMQGNPDSCGIWAPCLSHDGDRFYLIFTDVKDYQVEHKVSHNYLVTAESINGPWSEPIYLNSSGFDPSLFHDPNGKKYLVNMLWDHRPENNRQDKRPVKCFSGIVLQEFNWETKSLVGDISNIFPGTNLGWVEGPHLYKFQDYYYLLCAEGGTFHNHAAVFARSKQLTGPYEVDPAGHVLTSANDVTAELRRAGHASLVETQNNELYLAHLCGRPLPYRGRSVLGRETAIQKLHWQDGWPRMANGKNSPDREVPAPMFVTQSSKTTLISESLDFNKPLPIDYQSPRTPLTEDICSRKEKSGYLTLTGKEFIGSKNLQSLVARRQQAFCFSATTSLEFDPNNFQQMAGLVSYYNSGKYIYLAVTCNDKGERVLEVIAKAMSQGQYWPLDNEIVLPKNGSIHLKVEVYYDQWRGFYSLDGHNWVLVSGPLDYSVLSDEFGAEHFTGAFIGMCCQDVSGQNKKAHFETFTYQESDK